jgi:hypothetical protein
MVSTYLYIICLKCFNTILPSTPRSAKWLFPLRYSNKNVVIHFYLPTHVVFVIVHFDGIRRL